MKIRKITLNVLALVVAISCFLVSGCNNSQSENTENSAFSYGFDSYEEIARITTSNFQGSMSQCKEETFVTAGQGSLKLNVKKATSYDQHRYGEVKDYLAPTISFPVDEIDLANTQYFTLDVYNNNDYDTGLYLYATKDSKIVFSSYAVAPQNKWSKAVFSLNTNFAQEMITSLYLSIADTNQNTTYYFDNFSTVAGKTLVPKFSSSTTNILELNTANDLLALDFFTKTSTPASHLAIANDPTDGSKIVTALAHENYTGRNNPASYTADDKEYGFSVWTKVLARYDFSEVKKITLEVYNGMRTPKKICLSVSDGKNVAERETEVPVGRWTTISVNNLLDLNLALGGIKDISVTLNSYDNFAAGTIYFRNLSVEV